MKPLLSKTTIPFLLYILFVLGVSIPVYYYVIDSIWKDELDEHNEIVAEKTAYELGKLAISPERLNQNIAIWNQIQPGTNIERISVEQIKKDTIFTSEKYKPFSADTSLERYRHLQKVIYIQNEPYLFSIETNIEETENTVLMIGLTTGFFFLLIVIGLYLLNRKLSKSLWRPFHQTLAKLESFNLNQNSKIKFEPTDILEFQQLNLALSDLMEKNLAVYQSQKEFTQNASHELQTPLAILKSKLDLLLQNHELTEDQYRIAEEMNAALLRSSKTNKNLLLLAKIENHQFVNSEKFEVGILLVQILEDLDAHFEGKDLQLITSIESGFEVTGNRSLTEVLLNNLVLNAIRYTDSQGKIEVKLSPKGLKIRNSGKKPLSKKLLFKRFSKLSTEKGGNGLGLSIVSEICKFHRWKIEYRFKNDSHEFLIRF